VKWIISRISLLKNTDHRLPKEHPPFCRTNELNATMKTIVLLQARMGSTRLPGKVLKKLAGKSILEHLIDRLRPSAHITQLVVATTTESADDAIAQFCQEKNVSCYRGSEWDVLDRFYQAALPYQPDHVVRLTADCPLNNYEVVDFVVSAFLKSGCDYFSNSNNEPNFLEDGFDVEVFSFRALEIAWKEATLLSEREHVTPFIKNSGKFSCGWEKFDPRYTHKLSVDSPDDFAAVERIFEYFADQPDFNLHHVVDLLKQQPEILQLNASSEINSGYKKSLNEDKHVR
jgi:spore coat polysaccharide biosynthesis protein SpsF (cytidylyltransferase family)